MIGDPRVLFRRVVAVSFPMGGHEPIRNLNQIHGMAPKSFRIVVNKHKLLRDMNDSASRFKMRRHPHTGRSTELPRVEPSVTERYQNRTYPISKAMHRVDYYNTMDGVERHGCALADKKRGRVLIRRVTRQGIEKPSPKLPSPRA